MPANLRDRLAHVLWLGGSSCAGKSTIARRLAARSGIAAYHCDEHFEAHARRLDPSRHPTFNRVKDLSPEQLWMRPIDVQVAELGRFYDEEFEMVVEDLSSLPAAGAVIVEGAGLAPRRVLELIRHPKQALWLVTAADFRRRQYPRRGRFVSDLLAQCSDPAAAFDSWMGRDEERARVLEAELRALCLPYFVVDGRRSLSRTVEAVRRHFALGGRAEQVYSERR